MAFFSGAGKPELYSGVTITSASAVSISCAQASVCGLVYLPSLGWCGSSRNGRLISARSSTSTAVEFVGAPGRCRRSSRRWPGRCCRAGWTQR